MKIPLTIAIATMVSVTAYAATRASGSAALPRAAEGKVTGSVKFDGTPPEMKPLQVTDEKAKGCTMEGHKVDTTDPALVVGKDGGIANVVITIDVKDAELKPADGPVEIDQKGCRFSPHVRVLPAGSKIVFLNSDTISHNVHTYPAKNEAMNKLMAPGSKEEQALAKGDKVQVKCDIHDWMSAWIFVTDTPYYAVTQEDGSFEIAGLKPGKYKAELWHEKLGKEKAEIVIKDDGTSEPLAIKMGEKKKKGKT